MTFPFFKVIPVTQGYEAIAAIKVAALLHSDLLLDSYYAKAEPGKYAAASLLDPRQLHHAREALLSAMTSWTDTTLEIRLAVVPDLTFRTQSQINLHFLIRCCAEEADAAKEEVASRFLTLMPLLSAHCPEASCVAVTQSDELDQLLGWLQPQYALSVQRRREQISLAHPLANDDRPIGFNSGDFKKDGIETGEPVIQHLSPWVPELDDWGRLLDTLTCQIDPLLIILRLRPRQDAKEDLNLLNETLHQCENYLQSHNPDLLANAMLVQALRGQYIRRLVALRGPSYSVGVFLLSSTVIQPAFAQVLGAAITHLPQGNNDDHFFRGGFELQDIDAATALDRQFFADEGAFCLAEAACAFRLPSPPCREIAGLTVKRFRTALAKLSPPSPSQRKETPLRLFVNEHMGVTQPVTVNSDDRMRHFFLIGSTGCGKSTLMESMINQDIAAGRGVAVIDPHGDMIDNILQRIPHKSGGDVILFDFLDLERPIGFNLIAWRTIMERDLIIDELYRVLDHLYDMKLTGGPIFESYFRNMLRLLMGSEPRKDFIPTVLDFLRAFIDKNFREWLLEHSRDKGAKDFLTEAENTGGDASWKNVSPYITSKFSRFVNDTTLRRIIGQERSTLDFDDIINSGKILLVKLGKGRFGSQVSALLANMMILRFKLAAMKRGDMPMEQRRDFFLYVDEAHNLPQENFTEMLAEVRKYRMGLILATQYCSQLASSHGRGDDLLSAVFGNVGSMVIFRTGSQDASELAKGLRPYFTDLDITSLPNFTGYTRMNLGPDVTPPFSFRTELDPTPLNPKLSERIRRYSRLKYGLPADYVDDLIDEHDESWKKVPEEKPPIWIFDQDSVGDRLLIDLELSVRMHNCLNSAGWKTIRDVVALTESAITKQSHCGRRGLNELKEKLKELGVRLQDEEAIPLPTPKLNQGDFSFAEEG